LSCAGLFAGIGGLELGLQRAGHAILLLCEVDAAARSVLETGFARVPIVHDIRKLRNLPPGTDLVAAGFPCQDLSQAGGTGGISGVNSSLIGEVFRLLRRRRVPWVLLENVPFMLHLDGGRAVGVIAEELERLRYQWAYRMVDSRAFGVPQRRLRVFLLASRREDPRDVIYADDGGEPPTNGCTRGLACGFYWTEGRRGLGWAVDAVPPLKGGSGVGVPAPPAVMLADGRIVTPGITDAERLQGFPVNWTKPAELVARKSRRWILVGNAVTVQVARWIGERLASPGVYKAEAGDTSLGRASGWPRAAYNVGSGRFRASASAWPVRRKPRPLALFLRQSSPLSLKATAGFLTRARESSLRFPDGFLESVEAHLSRMKQQSGALG
jgi:DNA (cytosine-5)-methyltransferase 1